jgi:UDP-N-acetylmuramoyl-L-alanyl-D-glutamate--2,6-diaminopimelate ligase
VHSGKTYLVSSSALSGEYNLYNMLAAAVGALHVGLPWEQLQKGFATFSGLPGRLERHRLPSGQTVVIDYAHNPLSYQVLLSMLREQTDQLIVVFGAGGERDHGRRPEMGCIAAEYADWVILTTDNPRSEDPEQIITDIYCGILAEKRQKVQVVLDRADAIRFAYEQSHEGAIIALLGKGQEEYQLIGKKKVPYSERDIVRSFYRSRGVRAPL